MQRHLIAMGMALFLGACGGQSASDGTGGSAGAGGGGAGGSGGGSSGGSGGSSSGGAGGSAGSGAMSGAGGGNACNEPSLEGCAGPGECVLATSDCCLCGVPEITDYVAMNQQHAAQCACSGPICDCAWVGNPNLAASCEVGACAAWDVRQRDDFSGCTSDSDCRLRDGLDCCETCQPSPEQLVAVRTDSDAALKKAMCANGEACSKCMVQYPPNAKAVCNAGHCQVTFLK